MAHLVECPTSAQVMISWFVEFEPHTGFTDVSEEPASDPWILQPLPPPPRLVCHFKNKKKQTMCYVFLNMPLQILSATFQSAQGTTDERQIIDVDVKYPRNSSH